MIHKVLSDEMLGAYVDGELGPVEAARVARAVADNRELAGRVAVIARLKASVAHTPRAPAARFAARRGHRTVWRVACAAGALAAVALALWWAAVPPDPLDATIAEARESHAAWVRSGAREVAGVAQVRSSLRTVGAGPDVPDLSQAGLRFSHVRLGAGGRAVHVGYAGPKGCMVSLVVFGDGAAFPEHLERRRAAGRDVWVWRAGAGGYVLMADRMPRERLEVVARTVYDAVRRQAPLGPDGTERLMASRRQSPPCTA